MCSIVVEFKGEVLSRRLCFKQFDVAAGVEAGAGWHLFIYIIFWFFFLLGGGVLLGFAGPIGIKEPNEAGMYTIRESLGIF